MADLPSNGKTAGPEGQQSKLSDEAKQRILSSFASEYAQTEGSRPVNLDELWDKEASVRSIVATVTGHVEDLLSGAYAEYGFDPDWDDDLWGDDSESDEPYGLPADLKTFTFVGWSGSGKTTFLLKVVSELESRGIEVGVIKHHGHRSVDGSVSSLDVPGKDSSRYAEAGSKCVVVASATEYMVHRTLDHPRTLLELANEIAPQCDIIIAEGFKSEPLNPIEFCRKEASEDPVLDPSILTALVTNSEKMIESTGPYGTPVFGIDDVEDMCDFLCSQIGLEF